MARLPSQDFLSLAPVEVGSTTHVNHDDCTAGRDTKQRLYITRKEDGAVLAYCHNCALGGYSGSGKAMSVAAIKKRFSQQDIDQTVPLEDVKFPPDTDFVPGNHWPAKARAWLYKHRFTDAVIQHYDIGYSKELGRVILPVIDPDGKLLAWQGRSIDERVPKYITTTGVHKPVYWLEETSSPLVIVEDILSGLRLYGNEYNALALLGTTLPDDVRLTIGTRYNRALIWLDPDKAGQDAARKIRTSLTPLMKGGCEVISSRVQPKELSDVDIKTILDGHRTAAVPKTS